VKLISFNASSRDCGTNLAWRTASAENFSHFIIERSKDGSTYDALVRINHLPNQTIYSYRDVAKQNAQWFYRLKMVDIDGRFVYSNVLSSSVDCIGKTTLTIYPNPVNKVIYISSNKTIRKIMLLSITGQVVAEQVPAQLQPGIYSIPVTDRMRKGLYILQVLATDGTIQNSKLIKE
jgi:hypothetical protein